MANITNLKKQADGRWTWKADGVAYATNKAGNGMFEEDEYGFFNKQTVGTCDFKSCKTVSGMRRKLHRWFDDCEYVLLFDANRNVVKYTR